MFGLLFLGEDKATVHGITLFNVKMLVKLQESAVDMSEDNEIDKFKKSELAEVTRRRICNPGAR